MARAGRAGHGSGVAPRGRAGRWSASRRGAKGGGVPVLPEEIARQLEAIANDDDFEGSTHEIIDGWEAAGVGVEAVEPIMRFMEAHPSTDFGWPGCLVHFMERFYGKGYEQLLVDSVRRTPIPHTMFLLNRCVNGAKTPEERRPFLEALEQSRAHPLADELTVEQAEDFLARAKQVFPGGEPGA